MSTNPLGFVLPAATIGLGALLIRPRRGFFPFDSKGNSLTPITAQAVVEEHHHDELEITEHPVEQGAAIADHAFKRPAELIIRCLWSDSPSSPGGLISQAVGVGAAVGGKAVQVVAGVAATIPAAQSILSGNSPNQSKSIYAKLLALQESRIPFDILTGKRAYRNMLFKSLSVETNSQFENSLFVVAACKQVIIVTTQIVAIQGTSQTQKSPEKTAPIQNLGNQTLQPAPNYAAAP